MRTLRVVEAAENNLQGVSLQVPAGQWVAITGPSGSGKTSLVFDTVVAESQRRTLATLSARARHYLGKAGRARVSSIDGLPVAVAVGQRATTGNVRSTVGTLTGTVDLLRLLFARQAVDPGGEALTRSHFSFNHPVGACEACQGLGITDRVDPQLLVADERRSIRDGALVPTLKNGYTVYSQVTLEVMDQICGVHGFSVHTPWSELSKEQRDVILYGTKKIEVPFGKHSIESRMRWEGITARPRQQGFYRGLVPVITETLQRNRNPGVLRFVRSAACPECDGTRLGRPGREARLGTHTLPSLLARPVEGLQTVLEDLPASAVWDAVGPSVMPRLSRMRRLALGHLSLDRLSTSLSGGEAQRVRLAAQLAADLSGLLYALDEPTLGLFPDRQAPMAAVLDELVAAGNSLWVVEHDPDMVRYAGRVVAIGPGAGPAGGRVVSDGPTTDDPLGAPPVPKPAPRVGAAEIVLRGATLNNLQRTTIRVRVAAFNVVVGPSGAGKSSLVFGTLLPALSGGEGGAFESLTGASPGSVRALDARPIGRTSRSTPATFSGVFDLIRARFAASEDAQRLGLAAGRFSYNNKDGRCPQCEGLGVQRVGLHLLADAQVKCPSCDGGRYAPATLAVTLREQTIADVLQMSVTDALVFFAEDEPIARLLAAMESLGLGYLTLGQSSASLSRGEAQRVRLATLLGREAAEPTLLLLDEPDRGLHPDDIGRLLSALDRLVDAGHTVVAISHHRHVWAAADFVTHVQDGVATDGFSPPRGRLSRLRPNRPPATGPGAIVLSGVTTHNLQSVEVSIPHDQLTVVAGVSGSGKSSLVFHTLVSEAWHRFAESLPFAVRRFVRRLPRPSFGSASGLRPTLALRQGQARAPRRSTVATQSELSLPLRMLWSRAGVCDGEPSPWSGEHFSPDRPLGACPQCDGIGQTARCVVDRLVTDPTRALSDGALAGTRPGRFFSEPDGQTMATLQAALPDVDLGVPWSQLPPAAQQVALYGAGDRQLSVQWAFKRGKREGEHRFEGTWDGLCALVEREARRRAQSKQAADWAAPLHDVPCTACGGARLRPEIAATRIGNESLPAMLARPLAEVAGVLTTAAAESTDPMQRAVLERLLPDIAERLDELCALGLGHLSLSRRSQTLSEGELQRTRLAGVLRSGLTGATVVLDEPAAGLHPREVGVLIDRLQTLRDRGNTVVVVDHRPELIVAADHLIELGPGAGAEGGQIIAEGPAASVLAGDGPTARALRRPRKPAPARSSNEGARLTIVGARAHNLRDIDVSLPGSGFVAVTGVSGSGKSSLVFDVIEASARAGRAEGCDRIEGLDRFVEVRTARGTAPATTPLSSLGLMPALQRLFVDAAPEAGLPKQAFSYASPAGRCTTCKGSGRQEISMDVLADLALPCPACDGQRYRPEVLAVRWADRTVAEVLRTPVAALAAAVPKGKLADGIAAMVRVGLGHLSLGRRRAEMSGGEAQRLTLAASLRARTSPALYLLDEPATGLHEADLEGLVDVFASLGDRGDLVIAAEHRTSLIAAADYLVDLGPGGGPQGGEVVQTGTPQSLSIGATAATPERRPDPTTHEQAP